MADVIDFKDKIKEAVESSNPTEILKEVLQQDKNLKEILIFFKDSNDDYALFFSNNLSLPDKSMLIQLLQHEIFSELKSTQDILLSPDQ